MGSAIVTYGFGVGYDAIPSLGFGSGTAPPPPVVQITPRFLYSAGGWNVRRTGPVVFPTGTPPVPPTPYLKDNFAGTNGASIDSRPMDVGPGWSVASGANFGGWVIDSGRAKETGSLPITASIAISDAGVGDALAGVTVYVPSIATDSAVGVLARMSADFQNGWLAWADVFDQRIVISERTSGFFVLRAQLPAVLSYDANYSLSFRCTGASLTLTVAGVGTLSFTSSSNLTNTNFGVYGDSAPGQFVRSFLVTS